MPLKCFNILYCYFGSKVIFYKICRSSVFMSAAILALTEVILFLKNNESSSHFDAEKCRRMGGSVESLVNRIIF